MQQNVRFLPGTERPSFKVFHKLMKSLKLLQTDKVTTDLQCGYMKSQFRLSQISEGDLGAFYNEPGGH